MSSNTAASSVAGTTALLDPPPTPPLNDLLIEIFGKLNLNNGKLNSDSLKALAVQLQTLKSSNTLTLPEQDALQGLITQVNQAISQLESATNGTLQEIGQQLNAEELAISSIVDTLGSGNELASLRSALQTRLKKIDEVLICVSAISAQIDQGIGAWMANETTQTRTTVDSLLGEITKLETQSGTALPESLIKLKNSLNFLLQQFDRAVLNTNTDSDTYKRALSEFRIAAANAINTYLSGNGATGTDNRILANQNVITAENLWASSQSLDASSILSTVEETLQQNGIFSIDASGLDGQIQSLNAALALVRAKLKTVPLHEQAAWVIAETTLLNRIGIAEESLVAINNGDNGLVVGPKFYGTVLQLTASAYKGFESHSRNQITQPGGLNQQLEEARAKGDTATVQRLQTQINTLTQMADAFAQKYRVIMQVYEQVMRQYAKASELFIDAWREATR